jgi:hypothetical protein
MPASLNLVQPTGAQPVEITLSFSLTTTQVAGQLVFASIAAFGPLGGTTPAGGNVQVPITEMWNVVDIYNVGGVVSGGVNASLVMIIAGNPQYTNFSLATTNLNLLTRARLRQSLPLTPGQTWTAAIQLSAAPTAAVTQTETLLTIKAPYTG